MTTLEEAIAERDAYLEEKPHLKDYQEEVDRVLDGSGDSRGRMASLSMLIQCKMVELQEELLTLSKVVCKCQKQK